MPFASGRSYLRVGSSISQLADGTDSLRFPHSFRPAPKDGRMSLRRPVSGPVCDCPAPATALNVHPLYEPVSAGRSDGDAGIPRPLISRRRDENLDFSVLTDDPPETSPSLPA